MIFTQTEEINEHIPILDPFHNDNNGRDTLIEFWNAVLCPNGGATGHRDSRLVTTTFDSTVPSSNTEIKQATANVEKSRVIVD